MHELHNCKASIGQFVWAHVTTFCILAVFMQGQLENSHQKQRTLQGFISISLY